MNRDARLKLRTLARRRDYLRGLIDRDEANSYDRAEEAALRWAIRTLEAAS